MIPPSHGLPSPDPPVALPSQTLRFLIMDIDVVHATQESCQDDHHDEHESEEKPRGDQSQRRCPPPSSSPNTGRDCGTVPLRTPLLGSLTTLPKDHFYEAFSRLGKHLKSFLCPPQTTAGDPSQRKASWCPYRIMSSIIFPMEIWSVPKVSWAGRM